MPTAQAPATIIERVSSRIVVVGAGKVGSTFAYALLLSGLATEIVLIDADPARAEGEAMDIAQAVPFSRPTRVRAGSWADCAEAAVTVIAAGSGQRPGQSRLDLARANGAIVDDVVGRIVEAGPNGIILVATNPVDVLTHVALSRSGLPPSRVFGSGTTLDTGRFRALLGSHFGVDPRSVHAFIIGEHGDSEVPVWSSANIAGESLATVARSLGRPDDDAVLGRIFEQTRDAAYAIIERKGATFYAVAAALVRIVEAILRDQRTVLSVSSVVDGRHGIRDVCLSLPSIVGRGGVEEVITLSLTDDEEAALRRSADVVRDAIAQVTA
jgi:L-lactate dehydrogenase